MSVKKAPAKKAAAKKTTAAKQAPAKKTAAKKTAAKKTAAKKAPATKTPATKITAKKAAPTRAKPPMAGAAPPEPGRISSWNPSSGKGTVSTPGGDYEFDLMKTAIVNKGYVDLYVGRNVNFKPGADDADQTLEAT